MDFTVRKIRSTALAIIPVSYTHLDVYKRQAQDEALSAALSDAGFGLQFADVAVDSTGKVFGSSIPLSGAAPIQQPMPDAAQRPVEASGAALRQSGGEVHARLERAPQSVVERRNAPARPTSIQKPAAKDVYKRQGKLVFVKGKKQTDAAEIGAGDIGAITKLPAAQTGDTLCAPCLLYTSRCV